MTIAAGTEIILFRYSNYGNYSFIQEHRSVIERIGYVWMLKIGKKSSVEKITTIKESGGWMVLRSPKSEGGISYIASFSEFSETFPDELRCPEYYEEIIHGVNDDEAINFTKPTFQWFKLNSILRLDENMSKNFVVSKTGKSVDEVIDTTRTAVMYIKNVKKMTI